MGFPFNVKVFCSANFWIRVRMISRERKQIINGVSCYPQTFFLTDAYKQICHRKIHASVIFELKESFM